MRPAEARSRARLGPLSMAALVLLPSWVVIVGVYMGTLIWSVQISLTGSKLLPGGDYVGLRHYARLFASERWRLSLENLCIFALFFIGCSLILGFLLAVALDRRLRFESFFRTVFLYPQAMSFIVTGLVWQWLMNPAYGIQQVVRDLGLPDFAFAWTTEPGMAIYAVVLAGVWQASGVVMILMLAGLRGAPEEWWQAAKVEGIPTWRVYVSIILPSMRPMVLTAVMLLAIGSVKVYELVVALTNGGPGIATEVPAKFILDFLFARQNIGLASAASTLMLTTILAIALPWNWIQRARRSRGGETVR